MIVTVVHSLLRPVQVLFQLWLVWTDRGNADEWCESRQWQGKSEESGTGGGIGYKKNNEKVQRNPGQEECGQNRTVNGIFGKERGQTLRTEKQLMHANNKLRQQGNGHTRPPAQRYAHMYDKVPTKWSQWQVRLAWSAQESDWPGELYGSWLVGSANLTHADMPSRAESDSLCL